MAEAYLMPVDKIRVVESVQARGETSEDVIKEYAEAMDRGDEFPPIIVYVNDETGEGVIADGIHRYHAHMRSRPNDRILCEQRIGTIEDAQWAAITANQTHGFPRTHRQKRHAIRMAILHKKARNMTRREVAREVGVGHKVVGDVWAAMARKGEIPWIESPREKAIRAINDPANEGKSNREIAREIHVAEKTIRNARSADNGRIDQNPHPEIQETEPEDSPPEPQNTCQDCDYWIQRICGWKGDIRDANHPICDDFTLDIAKGPGSAESEQSDDPPPDPNSIELLEEKQKRKKRGPYRKLKGCVKLHLPKDNPNLFAVELRNSFSEEYLTACWTALKHIWADDREELSAG